jgi:hypothetical protein
MGHEKKQFTETTSQEMLKMTIETLVNPNC